MEIKTARVIVFLTALLSLPALVAAGSFTGRVVSVNDGDTIMVERSDSERVRVRLWGVDCPEGNQPWGDRATEFTVERCLDKTVLVFERDVDRYGRLVVVGWLARAGPIGQLRSNLL